MEYAFSAWKTDKKVAVLGGSGSYAIKMQLWLVLMLLTADLKPSVLRSRKPTPLADIGHFESERYKKNYIVDYLRKKILNFAIILSEENTNPVKYL
jgi:putative NIF3 family GTP cyclohydrolase 1 type 2